MTSLATYEVLEGVVQGGNDGGFKIVERWINYGTRYDGRHPKPGERIKVRVRGGKYVVQLVNEDQELPPEPAPFRRGPAAGRSPEEERRGVRVAALEAAVGWLATFAETEGKRPTSADVLRLAEKFEDWVYR